MIIPKNKIKVCNKAIKDFQGKLEKFRDEGVDMLMEQSIRAAVSTFLQNVIRHTPVGDYGDTGKQGGTLRKGWNARNIKKTGDGYEVEIYNDVDYAVYREHGHLTANTDPAGRRWIRGSFMLRNTEIEMTFIMPKILEQQFNVFKKKYSR